MEKLKIHFENCFGIRTFDHEFKFKSGKNTILIYAPNGTMKSSFAKTLQILSKGDKAKERIEDRLYPERTVLCDVLGDGESVAPQDICVIDAEDSNYDASEYCSSFLASKELKKRYDAIYKTLLSEQKKILTKLKSDSISSDCDKEIVRTFKRNDRDSFLDCLLSLKNEISKKHKLYSFRYNDVFDKGGKVQQFLFEHSSQLKKYFDTYTLLLSKSSFFHQSGDVCFGTYEAAELCDTVKNGEYFAVKHSMILADGTKIEKAEKLSEKIEQEKKAIFSDPDLISDFDALTDDLDANANLRAFKVALQNHPELLAELVDYESLRKRFWLGHLASPSNQESVLELIRLYEDSLVQLKDIVSDAQKEYQQWINVIALYNSRFRVPFTVDIANREDVIIRGVVTELEFKYKESIRTKDELRSILSKGEQRALFILQTLFEIEARKKNPNEQLVIFDDIADSFDYQNKYAIIEYLHDLNKREDAHFKCVVLTHNFDFFRVVLSRLRLHGNAFFAFKDDDGNISLQERGIYKNPFDVMIRNNDKIECFIALIPFVRNLIEYTKGTSSTEYHLLTCCLHQKPESATLLDAQISPILQAFSSGIKNSDGTEVWKYAVKNCTIMDLIMLTADKICTEVNDEMMLQNKIVLSIAIRLLAEQYMQKHLLASGTPQEDIDRISDSQESTLLEMCRTQCPAAVDFNVLERVNIMTPENIHLNSFMYEPLIDMSVHHLIKLYNDCKALA